MTAINTSSPPFSSLYPTDVTFENPLVNIEILGTSEGGGKLTIFLGNPVEPVEHMRWYLMNVT